jgi:tetratricopeptide (TPR) repeat protein
MVPKANMEKVPLENRNRWTGSAVWGVACALVIGVVLWFIDPASTLDPDFQAKDASYNLLVEGFRAGHLNLNRQPSASLARLSDPYNPAINAHEIESFVDLSYYRGKFYLYFGVTPALALYWPYAVLTGHYLSDKAAAIILFTVGFFIAATLLHDLWRRYLSNTSSILAAAGMFVMVLALALALNCNCYQVAISGGAAFMILALWATWRALHEPKARILWMLLAGLAYGLAVGSRPSLLFGGFILLLPAVQAWRQDSWRQAGEALAAAAGPAMLIGLGLMFYNELRFGNPFEFGWHYQLNSDYDPTIARQFSLHFLGFNIHFYFLEPLRWSSHFPFLQNAPLPPVPPGYDAGVGDPHAGLLANYPFLLLGFAAPLVWRGQPEAGAWILRWFIAAIFLLFAIFVLTLCLFFAAADRYEMDFLPELVILSVAGILGLERALACLPAWRWAARVGIGLLLIYSLVYNLSVNIEAHAVANYFMGNAVLAQGKIDEAIIRYQKALKLWPDSADANAGVGNAFFQKGQIDQAIVQYQKALEIKSDSPKVYNNLGYCFLQKGQVDRAIVQFQKAIELRPDSAGFHNILGNALVQKKNIQDAIIEYKKALDLNPDFADACYNLGYCLLQQGRADEAVVQYQKAVKIAPDSEFYHNALGNVFFQRGQLDQAIVEYQKVLEIKPGLAETYNNLGDCYLQKGRVDDAITQYQKALEIKQDLPAAHANLGFCFLRKGRVDEAIVQYQKAIELQPNFPEAYNNLGNAFRLKGNGTGAVAAYQNALELQPDFTLPRTHLAWMLATWPDASIRNGNKAVILAEKANQLTGGRKPDVLRVLAAAYAEAGRFAEAVSTGQKALAVATTQSDAAQIKELQIELGLYQNHSPCRSNN